MYAEALTSTGRDLGGLPLAPTGSQTGEEEGELSAAYRRLTLDSPCS
jgi:hypothetical protein